MLKILKWVIKFYEKELNKKLIDIHISLFMSETYEVIVEYKECDFIVQEKWICSANLKDKNKKSVKFYI